MSVEEIVKVSRNYQVTIPAKVRQKFQIKEGDLVKVIFDDGEGVVKIQIMKEPWK
ncbi:MULTISPECIES: AbrB/MazE/SpoVT family DNA-binding domain-containing protein [Sulfuracidifex]|uniref:AbrB/MazE/SpoVT family DNA-binding domain-containing protein n=2 Tax=Sulfuracidifex TaxID=2705406 RepID=A0A6A9QIJ7_SULME|nr:MULTISPECIES: AbrB/MazE/SpoVT family DNA-binding domain-containing protein [Sulfuracidifex]MCY0850839.1 AbrB/MazE/SpoVT family DNA-binding domain-containing protein [Sulfuracidifex metallicus]MUN28806.1 AbrB/MazE/SpoVT family DNA-binding domain-containing protein [Sulfuracidifex metallicus DSM 6482 = JCM 9184]WOE50679.1 AbrB/MazE/SpoVT family DNA-binding domain-containing protein [Sulfuracidifex metallicus DSM 6482 = JCM 9184]BBG24656.1 Repressor-like protein SSo7c4 [Sulfuracidifex tepidariu